VGRAQSEGEPIWDVIEQYLKNAPIDKTYTPIIPRLIGVDANPCYAQ
jgi:sulfur-oxidizing protein SoxB